MSKLDQILVLRFPFGFLLIVISLVGGLVTVVTGHLNYSPLFILLTIIGFAVSMMTVGQIEKHIDENLEKLKRTGEMIPVNFDNCEFRDSSYFHEIIDPNVPSGSYGYHDDMITEAVNQSSLTFYYKNGDGTEKFKSAFPFSGDALKFYVAGNKVTLYVDRSNRTHYFFDVKDSGF
jgi:hypothetical protein